MGGLSEMPLFAALREKMMWHQARQTMLAENVANAETPGYQGRDLAGFSFEDTLGQVSTLATTGNHFSMQATEGETFGAISTAGYEMTPEGNSVTLENEMMKVAENQMDYQAATTLYTRSMRMLRTALGRSA